MKAVTFKITGIAPLSQSRRIDPKPADNRQTAPAYEAAMWRQRSNTNSDGQVVIPPMAITNMLRDTAKFLNLKVPGQGQKTYTKFFEAGIMCLDQNILVRNAKNIPIKADAVEGETLFVPSNGVRGDGKRVEKTFPRIPEDWTADVTVHVLDDETITPDIFERHITASGKFIGLGRFRPQKGGFYGRFKVSDIEWNDVTI